MYIHILTYPYTHIPIYPYTDIPIYPHTHIPTYPHTHIPMAPMATEMTTLTSGCTAPGLVQGWFTDDNDGFKQALARLATKVNRGDAPQPLCPSLQALETMPHSMPSRPRSKIYAQSKPLFNDRDLTREARAFMRSSYQCGSGCGSTPSPPSQQFRGASAVFKRMLQIRLCLVLGFIEPGLRHAGKADTA